MKVLAFSDIHADLHACEAIVAAATQADLVIGAGDFAQRRDRLVATMAALAPLTDKAIYIPGNNETADELRLATDAIVLHGEVCEFGGLTALGLGAAVPPLPPCPGGHLI